LNEQIRKLVKRKGLYLYLFPTFTQAKKVIWQDDEMMKHFPKEIIEKKNDSELFIRAKNGSTWLLGGADNPDSWRGTNPIDVVFDEFPDMKEEVWTEVIRPVLTQNQGTATFVYTPKGKNHGWKWLEYAKQNPELWDWWIYSVKDTQAIPELDLLEAKREMSEALYNQEFMCEFREGAGSVFRRVRENTFDGKLKIERFKQFVVGGDLAKYQDWTVLTPFDLNEFKAGTQDRFNQIDWNLQEARIEAMHLRFNKAKVRLDGTGVGDPICESLEHKQIPIDRFIFTEQSKEQLLQNLVILLEKDRIKIPNDPELVAELESFQWKYNETSRKAKMISYGTDDRVMSLALAVWDLPQNPLNFYQNKREEKILLKEFDYYKRLKR
jgi:hypothetical protein